MSLKRSFLFSLSACAVALWIPASALAPQEAPGVAREEIEGPAVDFVNRSNEIAPEAMRTEDFERGQGLAGEVVENQTAEEDAVRFQRIFDTGREKLGADIMTILPNAPYGHVNRIERILTGYLMRAFEYNQADAQVVARFVLYYNARNRGQMEVFRERYSEDVAAALDPAKAGIDRTYRNWAGNTQIVLPLRKSAVRPGGQDVDINEVEKGKDQADESEKDEFDKVKEEREKDEQDKLDEKEAELKKQEEDLKKQEEDLTQKKEEVEKQKEETGRIIKELQEDPERNAEKIEEAEKKQEELEKQEEEIAKKQEEVEEKQEEVAKQQEEVEEQKEEVAEGGGEGGAEDGEVAAVTDENAAEEKPAEKVEEKKEEEPVSENVVGEKILFMRVLRYLNNGHYSNELWYIDAAQDDALFRGPFTNICGREFRVIDGQGVLVIGYKGSAHQEGDHNLVLLDPETLAQKKITNEAVFWRSPIIEQQNKLYVVEEFEGEYYLTRFSPDLTFEARTSESISPDSDVTFFRDKIYVTGKSQSGDATNIKVFQLNDLQHLKTIDPQSKVAAVD